MNEAVKIEQRKNVFTNFSDELKEEKIDGKIYLMATPVNEHIDVQENISTIFNNYFRQNKKRCRSRIEARLDFNITNYFRPDVMVFCYDNNKDIPIIVVEVLSISTRDKDLGVKMKKYAQLGIKEYWVVTWEIQSIDIYLLGDDGKYEQYKSYARFTEEDILNEDEGEEDTEEIITEFSPVSIPELKIKLEDVFYFVT